MEDHPRRGPGVDGALEVWSRRKWLAILCFGGAVTAAISLGTFLPNVYRSTATVLIERQEVSETFIKPSVTGELETRLHTISQEILGRSRLEILIERFGLYPELRGRVSSEAVIERMRRDIQVEFKAAESTGGRGTTIAFSLSYRGRDPWTVAQVANTLAALYVDQNLKIRERQAAGTTEFLRGQVEEIKTKVDQQERRVSEFKGRHIGELPQQQAANLATLERLNAQLRLNSDNQIRATERRERILKQLAELDPSRSADGTDATAARLARLKQELAELRSRFSDKYPDVVRVRAEIAALERQPAEPNPDAQSRWMASDPDDLPLRRLRETLRTAEAEIATLKSEERTLRQALATYQQRVENAPKWEQEFQQVLRDSETMKELYASLLKRYEDAQLAESVEQRQKGEQFRVLDPAIPPKEPAAPNRVRLILTGMALSLGLAAGSVLLAERLDASFHTAGELRAFSPLPVLVSIPRIPTPADRRGQRRRFVLGLGAAVTSLLLIVGASYYVANGNDQLVWMLTRGRS
ncbi:MAG: hypothetical protein HYV46_00505 [candidate division NC10 bacterium]|nr:hypothetical protein [candidate division NC10 bacterium]